MLSNVSKFIVYIKHDIHNKLYYVIPKIPNYTFNFITFWYIQLWAIDIFDFITDSLIFINHLINYEIKCRNNCIYIPL